MGCERSDLFEIGLAFLLPLLVAALLLSSSVDMKDSGFLTIKCLELKCLGSEAKVAEGLDLCSSIFPVRDA